MPHQERKVNLNELAVLVQAGWTNDDLVKHFNASKSTVQRARKKAGLVRTEVQHTFPWDIENEHKDTTPYAYIRVLNRKASGEEVNSHSYRYALTWAQKIIDTGQDLSYDPEYEGEQLSPYGGFYLVPADPENWYLKKLVSRL